MMINLTSSQESLTTVLSDNYIRNHKNNHLLAKKKAIVAL